MDLDDHIFGKHPIHQNYVSCPYGCVHVCLCAWTYVCMSICVCLSVGISNMYAWIIYHLASLHTRLLLAGTIVSLTNINVLLKYLRHFMAFHMPDVDHTHCLGFYDGTSIVLSSPASILQTNHTFLIKKPVPPCPRYLPAALDAWKMMKRCVKSGVSWLHKPHVPIQPSSTQVGYLHHAFASLMATQIPCLKPNFLCWNTCFCCLACHGDGLEVQST